MKLRPIPDKLKLFNDGYRGDRTVAWELVYKAGRAFEQYATFCTVCGQAWGYSGDIAQVRKLHQAMRLRGCPRCPNKPSPATKNTRGNDLHFVKKKNRKGA